MICARPQRSSSVKPHNVTKSGGNANDGAGRGQKGRSTTAAPHLSLSKKLAFAFVGFVLLPCLVLVLLESALRIGGFGYDPHYFLRGQINGRTALIENQQFGLSFFPARAARSPSPLSVPLRKDPGVVRIVVLGESAAQGDPRPAYSAPRYLRALLQTAYPSNRFEVVNTAMTAINSHAILPIARECARLDADLWLIYMGNNEMVGPFGATTVFRAQSPSAAYARIMLGIQRYRLGQLMFRLVEKLAVKNARNDRTWGGMGMFMGSVVPPDAPRKEVVYRNFQKNLLAIVAQANEREVPVLLSTVAVNLRECAPFASAASVTSPVDKALSAEALVLAAKAAASTGDLATAHMKASSAAALNVKWAEADYLKALFRNNQSAADDLRLFQNACDYDALPFRCDSRINGSIRALGKASRLRLLTLVDAEEMLAKASPEKSLFYEHVHLNFDGNYTLARAWAPRVAQALTQRLGPPPADWAGQELCERKLAITDWNKLGVAQEVMRRLSRPPFTAQYSHTEAVSNLQREASALRARMTPEAGAAAQAIYMEAVNHSPGDHRLHESFAEFLENTGRPIEAARQWLKVRELLPHHYLASFQAGRLMLSAGNVADAERHLDTALEMRPDLAEAWLLRGQALSIGAKHQAALSMYLQARELEPGDERVHYHIGKSLLLLGKKAEGITSLEHAAQLRPDFWEAHYALGEEFAFAGKVDTAATQFQRVLELNPKYAMAWFNLGVARYQQGRAGDAVQCFSKAMELDPKNERAAQFYNTLKAAPASTPR